MDKSIFRPCISFSLFSLLLLISINVSSQSVSISSGVGVATYLDFTKNESHRYANYEAGGHQYLKFELNMFDSGSENLSFHLKIDRSTAILDAQNYDFMFCGVGLPPGPPRNFSNTRVNLYRMSLGIMPVNLKLYKHIRFKVGTEVSRIYRYDLSDIDSENKREIITTRQPGEDGVNQYSVNALFEIQFGKYNLGNNLLLIPVYNSSIGITEEVETGFYSRAVRQSFGIAIQWGLKPRFK